MPTTTEAIKICDGNSSKHMKTGDSSWKRIGIKWKQNDNITLTLKLIN